MPTGSKLMAALAFGFLAWFVSELTKPLLPDGTPVQVFSQVNAIIGIVCGWVVMGTRTGRGNRAAMGAGLTTAAAVTFWALFVHSAYQMLNASTRPGTYSGPVEAIVAIFEKALENGLLITKPLVIGTLIVGGMLCGLISEWASRRWP